MTATVPMITLGMTVASNRRLSRFIDAPSGSVSA